MPKPKKAWKSKLGRSPPTERPFRGLVATPKLEWFVGWFNCSLQGASTKKGGLFMVWFSQTGWWFRRRNKKTLKSGGLQASMSVLLNGWGFKIWVTHFGKKKTTPPFFRPKSHWIYNTKSGLEPKFVPIEQKSFAFPEAPKQPSTMSCKYGKTIGKPMNLSLFIPRKQKPKTCSSGKFWRCDFYQQSFTVALMVYNNLHIHLQQIH